MKRINSKIKNFWGVSELGFSFMATMETSFFILFLTDVAMLPLSMVAIITGFSGIVDAITAILAGTIIDKTKFKNGKYRPWLIYCPPVVVVFFILMFTSVGNDLTTMILCSVGYIVSHAVWNIAWTANRAMVGVLSDDPAERAFLSGRIAAGASGGKILASWLVPTLTKIFIAAFIALSPVWGYTVTAAVASLTFLVTYLVHFIITKGYDNVVEQVGEGAVAKKGVSFGDMFRVILTNPQLVVLLLADAARLIGWYMFAATAVYYAKIVMQDPGAIAIILIIFNAGTLVGSLLSGKFAKQFSTKLITIVGTAGMGVVFLLMYFFPANYLLIYAALFVAQVIFGIAYGLTSNMYTMIGVQSEHKTGKDVRGTIMAFSSLAIKIAIALRGVIISAALAAIAYTPDIAITPEAQAGIKMVTLLIPAVLALVSAGIFIFFNIKDDDITRMEKEIAERKGLAAAE